MLFIINFSDGFIEVIINEIGETSPLSIESNDVIYVDKMVKYFTSWSKTSDGIYVE